MTEDRGVGLKGWLSGPKSKSGKTTRAERVVPMDKRRIAVLPLTNIAKDSADDYFADGMTEELIATLSKIAELKVIARTSVMRYKGSNKSIDEIARELVVGSVLEGSVRKARNQLRITTQLVDARTEEPIWSMDYDRQMEDAFAIQRDIAQNIASSLRVKILGEEIRGIEKRAPGSPKVYTLYLRGRYFWNRQTEEGLKNQLNISNRLSPSILRTP